VAKTKKKKAGATKRASTRKPASGAKKKATKARAAVSPFKAARAQLAKNLAGIDRDRSAANLDEARTVMSRMMADMDWLCDENNPDGCGPHMVFPRPN